MESAPYGDGSACKDCVLIVWKGVEGVVNPGNGGLCIVRYLEKARASGEALRPAVETTGVVVVE